MKTHIGLTQDQVAEKLEMSQNFYGLIERGQKGLSIKKLELVNEVFNLDLNFLITGKNGIPFALQPVFSHFPKELSSDKIFCVEQILRNLAELIKS